MRRTSFSIQIAILGLLSALLGHHAAAQAWTTIGPYGGDARSFAYSPAEPAHILLGTTNSWIYETNDGIQWSRLSKISTSDSLVLDHILFDTADPKRIIVGAWMLDRQDGGIFISSDEGHHWKQVPDMQGQSVRALAQSASDPKIFVAGTLKGIYRSEDGGLHWALISPMGSTELHEVESIAIDPANPQDIYAGTWHLPWKTQDGGRTWQNIKQGMIDDSDVFSIIVDPHTPATVYASACSGIYKSIDAGSQFHKIQGIPSTARRTRVLKQDPTNPNVVYAGTTEGLYKTTDAGTKWSLMTPKDIIINDVYVDPKNSQHVLMATDRSGVLDSEDGGQSFHDSNNGFSQRQLSSMVVDPNNPDTIYVSILNDKRFGGVFVSRDAGKTWSQTNNGLDQQDVFVLAVPSGGNLLAGTSHGIYRWKDDKWIEGGTLLKRATHKVTRVNKKQSNKKQRNKKQSYALPETLVVPDGKIDGSVHGFAFANGELYAATSDGLYISDDSGFAWTRDPVFATHTSEHIANQPTSRTAKRPAKHAADFEAKLEASHISTGFWNVAAGGYTVLAYRLGNVYVSQDQAKTWKAATLPTGWGRDRYVAIDAAGRLWVGGRLGVSYSDDQGQTWQASGLPFNNISGLQYDPQLKRTIATSYDSDLVFGIDLTGKHWVWWNPGWRVHIVTSTSERLIGATLLHGVIQQPEKQAPAGSF